MESRKINRNPKRWNHVVNTYTASTAHAYTTSTVRDICTLAVLRFLVGLSTFLVFSLTGFPTSKYMVYATACVCRELYGKISDRKKNLCK